MIESWRWFGPDDPVTLSDIRQTGATGIVTALHGVPAGVAWRRAEVEARRDMIRAAGLDWVVVESIPVHEDIKTGAPGWEAHADAWAESLRVLAAAGIRTVCYNFMPVLDWTRTDLAHELSDGARCLRYDAVDAAVFDIFVLERAGARADHRADIVEAATRRNAEMDEAGRQRLTDTIIAGLPGAEESWTLEAFRARLAAYDGIGPEDLRANLFAFLDRVLPVAEELGVALAIHPDDPPFPLFGLPRVVSTEADLAAILGRSELRANGLTFCTGSLGVRPDNDLPAMLDRFGDRVHFLHLRSTRREADGISFHEAEHLGGDAGLVRILGQVLGIEAARETRLPMRPDHGHMIAWDQERGMRAGYPYLGRMRGLAELRGVAAAYAAGVAR
ncbi:mannonate dehydratase [Roseivivax sp. GX 12232]|uniref:mannonate dehydratase n=1 Tax=Roseivivax sp. GX 12232 TaxID=2900547 RepID=UPI001E2C7980|nr:mannonate dehydratase [Roseivivax sp. GX 12232]MCE0506308.1 mannonate dehydratase [Roseivivax sp. GX 12232]